MTDSAALLKTDIADHGAKKGTISDSLAGACKAARKSPSSIMLDYWRVARGPGRLQFPEYVDFRLYDRELFPEDDQRWRFLSERRHWPLCYACSSPKWDATTEDKWVSEVILREAGIRATSTVAVLGGPARSYGRTPRITDVRGLEELLATRKDPLFAKVNGGIASQGAAIIVPMGRGNCELVGSGEMSVEEAFRRLASNDHAYLLQEIVRQHSDVARLWGGHVATVRAITFVPNGEPHTPIAVLKIPANGNVADNFWRSGNLLADLDMKTGEILRVVRGSGPALEEVDTHPDTGAKLVGARLPWWNELRDLTRATAEIYAKVGYQSLDIAIAPEGPTVVEVNTGSAFNLSQIVKSEGFLTDEVIELFHRCGAQIDTRKLNYRGG